MSINQEVIIAATPKAVFAALTEGKRFAEISGGAPATLSASAGEEFSLFGGHVTGRNIELVPGQRLVQAWRAKTWPEGQYSLVRFELKAEGKGTRLVFEHVGYPQEAEAHLAAGWDKMYWSPLKAYLQK